MTRRFGVLAPLLIFSTVIVAAQTTVYRTHNDRFEAPRYASREQWEKRASYLREHVLASAGLLPMPVRTPLNATVFDETRHPDYIVSKVYFESLPGFYVTGNLYRPAGEGPFAAILSPHGHWTNGRLEDTTVASIPGRAINLARQGFVVFSHDMIGYNDSRQLTHTFGGRREALWGLSLSGLQLWNSIRALDFLETLPYVRKDGFGATGESGGGTQTFLLAAVDPRVSVAAPVNMISLHMQGGCVCENPPGLRLDTNNVEIAGTIAPRPLLMISATGDWTNETLENEFPAMRGIYALFDAASRVHAVRIDAPHNFNKDSREAMYAWMARWLQHAPADATYADQAFTVDSLAALRVFPDGPLPVGAKSPERLTEDWIAASRAQLAAARQTSAVNPAVAAALRHALGFGDLVAAASVAPTNGARRIAVVADVTEDLTRKLAGAGFEIQPVTFTPFDQAAAEKVRHFETYNRTAASGRVADIVKALRASPSAILIAGPAAGAQALLAAAIVPVRRAIVDVDGFDLSSDQQFLDRLYIPGLRRAGDFTTAALIAQGDIVVHNAGDRFTLPRVRVEKERLTPANIVSISGSPAVSAR